MKHNHWSLLLIVLRILRCLGEACTEMSEPSCMLSFPVLHKSCSMYACMRESWLLFARDCTYGCPRCWLLRWDHSPRTTYDYRLCTWSNRHGIQFSVKVPSPSSQHLHSEACVTERENGELKIKTSVPIANVSVTEWNIWGWYRTMPSRLGKLWSMTPTSWSKHVTKLLKYIGQTSLASV